MRALTSRSPHMPDCSILFGLEPGLWHLRSTFLLLFDTGQRLKSLVENTLIPTFMNTTTKYGHAQTNLPPQRPPSSNYGRFLSSCRNSLTGRFYPAAGTPLPMAKGMMKSEMTLGDQIICRALKGLCCRINGRLRRHRICI